MHEPNISEPVLNLEKVRGWTMPRSPNPQPPPTPASVDAASMHKESNERRDSTPPDGSHQSPFSSGGVVLAVGGGGVCEGRHRAFNLNKLIDFLVWPR